MIQIILENKQPRQTFTKNLSGLSLCFLRIKYCLSVGAFFELLRANAVRPYRVLDKYFVISPLRVHAVRLLLFSHSKIQINPPLPSLMIRSRVSESLVRDASGICSSLVWMLSPTSS